ncbi:Arginine biosynthesis bifunctional protein ArgJ [Sinobacterium norvegicum]|uniref:Arginine biosynthesis bifunctional protein ArgJ n=1 Tax=Sinobacterium norvegicum TaxID=1641715 RepID=A0ABM9AIW7_9GAMM|nr:bifunctional glutamate N-acetyltransferase/amino-acid acetyltransferase ArgJ [Sinobacterium norvegicum]CAH0993174.1 Arginine biosynthesis bifunctional protein ArgJ [Sinobacterium norvegicum]
MAVGNGDLPVFFPIKGFALGTASAGIKTAGRKDLVVMAMSSQAVTAGVFTKNAFCAAPVHVAKQHLSTNQPSYLLVNTGNANAGTGKQGMADALASCAALGEHAGTNTSAVLPFSTGVIGEPLPVDKIVSAIPDAIAVLSEDGWVDAASGIMTTDTRPKGATSKLHHNGIEFSISGITKGAGMIKPNMATMLGYIATDAKVPQPLLQQILTQACNQSFNRITIDGDTSTNDALTLTATGEGELVVDGSDSELLALFSDAITDVCIQLAQLLVRDGEGASKFVTVDVRGGESEDECLKVAYTVAESPLVKTALFASDPNWGRLLAAIGRAGVDNLDVDKVAVSLNNVVIAENGCRAASYTEEAGQAVMDQEEITIRVELNRGEASTKVWTTDLSHEYVRINAEYRT